MEKIAKKYLGFLEAGDLNGVLSLFSPMARVFSPVYGSQLAEELFNNYSKTQENRSCLWKPYILIR